jgi:pimeloyl-ACP methyl ester carboxylesterase
MHNDIHGRADDVYSAVQRLQNHPSIDPAQIGLIGHSQGGWVVTLAAAQHEEVAFFISLAGLMTTVSSQIEADRENYFRCQGYEGGMLANKVGQDLQRNRLSAGLGEVFPIGEIRFMSGIIDFDPRAALQTVNIPRLLVYGGMVPADQSLARLEAIFNGNPPDHLETFVIADAQYVFRLVDNPCRMYEDYLSGPLSDELIDILKKWLTEKAIRVNLSIKDSSP